MRIAWTKMTMTMELDFNQASNGLGEERPMLFKSMLERGHSVKLLTPIKKQDIIELEKAKTDSCDGVVNNNWMKGIEYDPSGFADGCDVLIIENGPLNITFIDHLTNQPQIRRVVDIINRFNGLVIWYQTDPLLPFPFWRLTMAPRPWSHFENNVRNKRAAVEDDGWGDFDELFNDKKVVCIGKAVRVDLFASEMDGERFRYKYFEDKGLISFDYLPTGYDHYFLPHINHDWRQKIYPLTYLGFPRSRMAAFKKFYGQFLENVHVYGPWDGGDIKKGFLDEFRAGGMRWYGYAKGYLEITKMYDESLCCINLVPGKGQDLGWITNRVFESIFCGCLVLGDKGSYAINDYVPEELLVDEMNVKEVVERIINFSQQEYCDLMNKQYAKVEFLNYDYIVSYLEALIRKHTGTIPGAICYPEKILKGRMIMEVKEGEREALVPPNYSESEPISSSGLTGPIGPGPCPVGSSAEEIIVTPQSTEEKVVIIDLVLGSYTSKFIEDLQKLQYAHNKKRCIICNGAGFLKQSNDTMIQCPICQGSGYKKDYQNV